MNSSFAAMARLLMLAMLLGLGMTAARAATPAESFVSDNIQKGLGILNDAALPPPQRAEQFQTLLLGITDMKRIALFTLGAYTKTATDADKEAFAAAFRDYSVSVYRSYLGRYAGQTLTVTGSRPRTPDDIIVTTHMNDPNDHSGAAPLEVDFRVRTDSGRPELTDLGIGGIWLALEERDQFAAYLSQHNGDVAALTAHVKEVGGQYR